MGGSGGGSSDSGGSSSAIDTKFLNLNKNILSLIDNQNNLADKQVDTLIDFSNKHNNINEKLDTILQKNQNLDISLIHIISSQNDRNQTYMNNFNNILQSIVNDSSGNNANFVNYMQKFDLLFQQHINTEQQLTALASEQNDIIDSLKQTQDLQEHTQQQVVEYIGKYIVIPLFEQRINDITALNYAELETLILTRLNTALYRFRIGNMEGLTAIFNQNIKEEYAQNVLALKKKAFERYIATSPGATSTSDLTLQARNHYKTFKKYILNIFRTLDGLSKATLLYSEFKKMEGIAELYKIKAEILENPERLKQYLEAQSEEARNAVIMEASTTLSVAPIIKPQYIAYIRKHGVPEGLIFDADKMAMIIVELVESGIMDPLPEYPITYISTSGFSEQTSTGSDATTTTSATDTDTATATDTDTGTDASGNDITATDTDTATATDTDSDSDWPGSGKGSDHFSEMSFEDTSGDEDNDNDGGTSKWDDLDYFANPYDTSNNDTSNNNTS